MGISRLTAIIIATNEVESVVIGPNDEGKYCGTICHSRKYHHIPLISTDFIFDTNEEALAAMNEKIGKIRDLILYEEKNDSLSDDVRDLVD